MGMEKSASILICLAALGLMPRLGAAVLVPVKGVDKDLEVEIVEPEKDAPVRNRGREQKGVDNVSKWAASGFLNSQYRYRSGDGKDDHDLYETLGLGLDRGGKIKIDILGRVTADLDADTDQAGYYVFDSLADSKKRNVDAQIYAASFEFCKIGRIDSLKLGRQSLTGTPELAQFDGISVQADDISVWKRAFALGVYAGLPVRYYESSNGGGMGGLFVSGELWKGNRTRVDWMHVSDEVLGNSNDNDVFSLNLDQFLNRRYHLSLGYSFLEEESRDLKLGVNYSNPECDLQVLSSCRILLNTQKDYALEFNPYYSTLREIRPYTQGSLLVSKGLGEHVLLDLGYDFRQVRDDADVGTNNREFDRYFLTSTLRDLPWDKSSLGLTGEYWKSGERNLVSYGLDMSHRCTSKLEASVGTQFSLYKYDFYQDRERNEVQSYYTRVRYELRDNLKLRASYEFEDDDIESYHVLKMGIQCLF
ncbi:MAG: hypothetical protein HQL31_05435 [Planctomycetes bacterium]|nr:hypothetical protein [Planctomycetota bacterium]